MILVFCVSGQLGCCGMMQGGCGGGVRGSGPSCGIADASCGVADASCGCPSCGVADASCGCADASCGFPDASCGCPTDCGSRVGSGGTPVVGGCRILSRIRKALNGCSAGGCGGGPAYYNEWQDSPPSQCETCDQYGNYTGGNGNNYTGGPYASPHGRRARLVKTVNLADELRLGEGGAGTIYR